MPLEENKAVIRRLFSEVLNKGNLDLVDDLISSDYTHYDSANPDLIGPNGYKELVTKYRNSFSDLKHIIKDIVAEEDKVVVRFEWSGTHDGYLEGIAPTGTHTKGMGISIFRFSEVKIEECWDIWDALGLMQQLGVVA